MHLGLTEPAPDRRLSDLWPRFPGLSIGRATPRRDRWSRLAGRLDLSVRGRLPPDPGVRAYLAQLDLDLLLLAASEPGTLETDYRAAAASLRLPATTLAGAPSVLLAQATPGALAPARALATPPDLWARLVWNELTQPPEPVATEPRVQPLGLGGDLQEAYARRIYPALASAALSLAPSRRPLLKAALKERLGRGVLPDEISAEGAMTSASQSQGMVVLGPWWGEADQELLYWVPFASWWRRRYGVDKERIVAVSSGQAGPWYEGVAGRYIDLSELYDPDALAELEQARREELESRGKRFGTTEAERQLLKRLNRRLGFRGVVALPAWTMAVMLDRYWSGAAGPALLASRTRAQPLKIKAKRARKIFPGLPGDYLVVGACREARDLAPRLAAEHAVVILAESEDGAFAEGLAAQTPGAQAIVLDPRAEKDSASALLAAAAGFAGPPGWMAHAAAAQGRPAVCLGPRDPVLQTACAQLLVRPPLFLDSGETELAALALHRLVAGAAD